MPTFRMTQYVVGPLVAAALCAPAAAAAGWSAPQKFPGGDAVARVGVADNGRAAVVIARAKVTEVMYARPGARFGGRVRLPPTSNDPAIAVKSNGAVAVLQPRTNGLFVTVRTREGAPWKTIKLGGGRDAEDDAAIAADPLGGWVVAYSHVFQLRALSLKVDGTPVRKTQRLGAGQFTPQPTGSLAVDPDGRAVFVADTRDPNDHRDLMFTVGQFDTASVFTRSHGGKFRSGRMLGNGMAEPRVAVSAAGHAVVVATDAGPYQSVGPYRQPWRTTCADGPCRGATKLFTVGPDGYVSRPATVQPDGSGFSPAVALLDDDQAAVIWQAGEPTKARLPAGMLHGALIDSTGSNQPTRIDDSGRASQPLITSVGRAGALVVWASGSGLQGSLLGTGNRTQTIEMPGGPGPARVHPQYHPNRALVSAGRWAIVAWNSARPGVAGRLHVSVRKF